MMSKLYGWIAAALAAVAAIFVYGRSKKKEGEQEVKKEQQDKVVENVKRAKESEDATDSKPVDERIERMRKRARGGK